MPNPKVFHATTKLSKSRYAAIGKVMVSWAALEFTVGNIVAKALGLKVKEGRIAMARLSLRPKFEMLILVAKLRNDDILEKELNNFWNKTIKPLEEGRNDMAHGVWMVPSASVRTGVRLVKFRGGDKDENRLVGKAYRIQTKNITALANSTERAITQLTQFSDTHSDVLFP